jgi:hypothetical protein
MKRMYEKPTAEKVEFNYQEQVVAASGGCQYKYVNVGADRCGDGHWTPTNPMN